MPLSGLITGSKLSLCGCLRTKSSVATLKNKSCQRIRTSAKLHYEDYDEGKTDEDLPKRHIYLQEDHTPEHIDKDSWGKYKIRHRFQGLNPRRLDLDAMPRFRTDFNGQRGKLAWMGLECAKCGMQIRREKRTNRETSLNVYSHDSIPENFLRSCSEKKLYPLLWRSRDPFVVLDILGIDDWGEYVSF